jgi:hypothetical protein
LVILNLPAIVWVWPVANAIYQPTLRPSMRPATVGRNDIRALLLSVGTASIDSLTRRQTHGALRDKPLSTRLARYNHYRWEDQTCWRSGFRLLSSRSSSRLSSTDQSTRTAPGADRRHSAFQAQAMPYGQASMSSGTTLRICSYVGRHRQATWLLRRSSCPNTSGWHRFHRGFGLSADKLLLVTTGHDERSVP